jgi:O-Antigen ligase
VRAAAAGIDGERLRGAVSPSLVVGAFTVFAMGGAVAIGPRFAAISTAIAVFVIGFHRVFLAWQALLAALLAVIFFVPVGRYQLPVHLPFSLDIYRFVAILIALAWITSLLIDQRVRLRMGFMGPPILVVLIVTLLSDIANLARVQSVGSVTVKRLSYFASFALIYFLFVSLVRSTRLVQYLIRVCVTMGAVLALFGLLEFTTGYNAFSHFATVLPLQAESLPLSLLHPGGGRLRVLASAESPIALGALLVLLLPLAAYLWSTTRQRRWLAAALGLLLGNFATESRTSVVMLVVEILVLIRLRPRFVMGMWPFVVPLLLAIHFTLPGAIGSLKDAFFPSGGLVAQQEFGANTRGSGRLADLRPALDESARKPILGEGYGTRITDRGPTQNANILDDEWLSTLLETGVVGVFVWILIFGRFFRRLSREARADSSPRGWLCAALAAATLAFAVGMLTYDTFSFVQVTVAFFVLLALGSVAVDLPAASWTELEST